MISNLVNNTAAEITSLHCININKTNAAAGCLVMGQLLIFIVSAECW